MTPIIHLVDDDAPFRTATSRLLRASGFEVVAFSSAKEFLAQIVPTATGCAIVDLQMPEMSGLDLQEALAEGNIALPIVFLTGRGDIPSTVRAMRDGAEDFLEKRAPKEKLLNAVRRAIERDSLQRAVSATRQQAQAKFDTLTEREREVLSQVLRGALNKQIAGHLGIAESTVKAHRTNITTKLGVYSVAEIARLAQEAGLFS
jgi:FixJ family two-component response regulator